MKLLTTTLLSLLAFSGLAQSVSQGPTGGTGGTAVLPSTRYLTQTSAPDTARFWLNNASGQNTIDGWPLASFVNGKWDTVGWYDPIADHFQDRKIEYTLAWGQSNMEGFSAGISGVDTSRDSRVIIWDDPTNSWVVATQGNQEVAGDTNPAWEYAKAKAENTNRVVRYFQLSQVGQKISFWLSTGGGYAKIRNEVPASGVTISEMLVFQGESDIGTTLPQYAAQLQEVLEDFRGESWYDPQTRVAFAEVLQTNIPTRNTNPNIVFRELAASDPLITYIRTDDLERNDVFHLKSESQKIVGERFFRALQSLPDRGEAAIGIDLATGGISGQIVENGNTIIGQTAKANSEDISGMTLIGDNAAVIQDGDNITAIGADAGASFIPGDSVDVTFNVPFNRFDFPSPHGRQGDYWVKIIGPTLPGGYSADQVIFVSRTHPSRYNPTLVFTSTGSGLQMVFPADISGATLVGNGTIPTGANEVVIGGPQANRVTLANGKPGGAIMSNVKAAADSLDAVNLGQLMDSLKTTPPFQETNSDTSGTGSFYHFYTDGDKPGLSPNASIPDFVGSGLEVYNAHSDEYSYIYDSRGSLRVQSKVFFAGPSASTLSGGVYVSSALAQLAQSGGSSINVTDNGVTIRDDRFTPKGMKYEADYSDELLLDERSIPDIGTVRKIFNFSIFSGFGSPEGAVSAPTGSMYLNRSGGAGTTLWVKESGGGTTGWAAK